MGRSDIFHEPSLSRPSATLSPRRGERAGRGARRGRESPDISTRLTPLSLVRTRSTASHSFRQSQGGGGTRPYRVQGREKALGAVCGYACRQVRTQYPAESPAIKGLRPSAAQGTLAVEDCWDSFVDSLQESLAPPDHTSRVTGPVAAPFSTGG